MGRAGVGSAQKTGETDAAASNAAAKMHFMEVMTPVALIVLLDAKQALLVS
jgi:hypothetical protein